MDGIQTTMVPVTMAATMAVMVAIMTGGLPGIGNVNTRFPIPDCPHGPLRPRMDMMTFPSTVIGTGLLLEIEVDLLVVQAAVVAVATWIPIFLRTIRATAGTVGIDPQERTALFATTGGGAMIEMTGDTIGIAPTASETTTIEVERAGPAAEADLPSGTESESRTVDRIRGSVKATTRELSEQSISIADSTTS